MTVKTNKQAMQELERALHSFGVPVASHDEVQSGTSRRVRRRKFSNAAWHDSMQCVVGGSAPVVRHARRIVMQCIEEQRWNDLAALLSIPPFAVPRDNAMRQCFAIAAHSLIEELRNNPSDTEALRSAIFHVSQLVVSNVQRYADRVTDMQVLSACESLPQVWCGSLLFIAWALIARLTDESRRTLYAFRPPPDVSPTVTRLIVASILAPRAPQAYPTSGYSNRAVVARGQYRA